MITLWSYLRLRQLGGPAAASCAAAAPCSGRRSIGIFAIWGVEVPAAYLLMHHFGLDGVWLGYPIAYCIGLALQFCYYEFVWKKKTHERLV